MSILTMSPIASLLSSTNQSRPSPERTRLQGSRRISRTCLAAVIDSPEFMTQAHLIYAAESLVILGHRVAKIFLQNERMVEFLIIPRLDWR